MAGAEPAGHVPLGATVTGWSARRGAGRCKPQRPCPDQVVIAAGVARSRRQQLGVRPLITWSKDGDLPDGMGRMPARPLVDETNLIAVTRLGSYLRVTAIAEFAGHDSSPNPERARIWMTMWRATLAARSSWMRSHIGPVCAPPPQRRPYLGRLRTHRNVWLNAGHGQLGWTMAAGAGCAQ